MLVGVAEGRAFPAAECVIGDGDRDRHVDADHADIDAGGEFAGGVAVAGEDGDAIAILMLAGEGDGFFETVGADHLEDGAENLFLIGAHAGGDMVEQGGADEEAFLMALQREAAAVDHQLGAFIDAGLNPVFDLLLVRGGDDRAIMGFGIGGDADAQGFDGRNELFAQRNGGLFADRHDDGEGHAALARRAEGGAGQVVDHLVEIGVGHDDAVIFRAAHRLDALSGGDAAIIDIMGDVGRADEADALDVRVVEDGVDHFLVALNDLEDAVGQARFAEQFGEAYRHRGVTLGGLEDEGVAGRDGDARHPQRDHAGEVEGRDASANADRLAEAVDVDARACALGIFALEDVGDAAAKFDDFEAALNVALGVRDHLAMFGAEQMGQLGHVRFDQRLEIEHDAGAALRVDGGPGGLRFLGSGDGEVEQGGIAQRHAGLDAAIIGIEHVAIACRWRVMGEGELVRNLTHGRHPLKLLPPSRLLALLQAMGKLCMGGLQFCRGGAACSIGMTCGYFWRWRGRARWPRRRARWGSTRRRSRGGWRGWRRRWMPNCSKWARVSAA